MWYIFSSVPNGYKCMKETPWGQQGNTEPYFLPQRNSNCHFLFISSLLLMLLPIFLCLAAQDRPIWSLKRAVASHENVAVADLTSVNKCCCRQKVSGDYEALNERLQTLPDQLSYDIMVSGESMFGWIPFTNVRLYHPPALDCRC